MRSRLWNYPKPWTRPDLERTDRVRMHAVVLDQDTRTVTAARELRAAGFEVTDVYSPYPLHGIEEAIGLRPTRLSAATLAGAAAGGLLAIGFQAWVGTIDWPMNIGGKSYLALPALAPVTFELAVLLAAFATVGGLIVRTGLLPRGEALQGPMARVTDDRFVILVREDDGGFDLKRFRELAQAVGAERVVEGWRVR